MLNTELKYLITQDNNEIEPLISHKFFDSYIDYLGIICTSIIVLITSYKKLWLLTGLLTPGNEFIEIMLILISIGLFIICKLIANFILNELSESFNKLKDKNDENNKIIRCLNRKNTELKRVINELKTKNYELEMKNNGLKIDNTRFKQKVYTSYKTDYDSIVE